MEYKTDQIEKGKVMQVKYETYSNPTARDAVVYVKLENMIPVDKAENYFTWNEKDEPEIIEGYRTVVVSKDPFIGDWYVVKESDIYEEFRPE